MRLVASLTRHVFVNIIECILLDALNYSSTLTKFTHTRRLMKLILFCNGLIDFERFSILKVLFFCGSHRIKSIHRQFMKFLKIFRMVICLTLIAFHRTLMHQWKRNDRNEKREWMQSFFIIRMTNVLLILCRKCINCGTMHCQKHHYKKQNDVFATETKSMPQGS